MRVRGHHRLLFNVTLLHRLVFQAFCKQSDVLRRRAAAAAENRRAFLRKALHVRVKFLRPHGVRGLAVHGNRQTGVRVDDNGQIRQRQHFIDKAFHLLRTEAAVDAHRVRTEALRQQQCRRDVAARQELSRAVKRKRYNDRQVTVFLCRKQRRLRFVGVAHRLDDYEIGVVPARDNFLFKKLVRVIKRQITERLQKLAGGADVERHRRLAAARRVCKLQCL